MAKFVDFITWDDCAHLQPPHISKEDLDAYERDLPPHQREARRKGVPSIGSGAVYPVSDESLLCDPFEIPGHWGRGYGLDVGWRVTAAAFLALDPDTDTFYVTGEYYGTQKQPAVHAYAIRALMPYPLKGAVDPASEATSQVDGRNLLREYKKLGLDLKKADNAVEAGLHQILLRMQSGRFKVFRTCEMWMKEKRLYRRKGDLAVGASATSETARSRIVKIDDHLQDATRYGTRTPGILRKAPAPAVLGKALRYGEF